MESTFGVLALAASIFLAITCLCVMKLDYDELYAADERAILFAAAAGNSEVKLMSTEVLRGYFIAVFLLLFAALLSTISHVISTTKPKYVKLCWLHRILKSFALYLVLFSFGCGIILSTLSVTSLLENESPKWCVPGTAIQANLFTSVSPISVPLGYVYNDETESSILLTGSELNWEDSNLPSKPFRGEFKRNPFIDLYGRHCFAVNKSVTTFWREAIWKYAIPFSIILCIFMMMASCCDTIEIDEIDALNHRHQEGHHRHKHHHHQHISPDLYSSKLSNFVHRTSDALEEEDREERLINPYYENDVPILKFLKVAKLSKSARASIILGGLTEGNRPPLQTVQDLAWDPCFCHMSLAEACDPVRMEHDFGIRDNDVHRFKVALSTARELRRWIELQSLGVDERLANASYRFLTQDERKKTSKFDQNNQTNLTKTGIPLTKQKSFSSPLGEGEVGGLGMHSIGLEGSVLSDGGGGSSSSFTHNRLVIEKKVGIESLQSDLSELLINSNNSLSDEVLYQAFKDAGVVHPGERLRMISLLRSNTTHPISSSAPRVSNSNSLNEQNDLTMLQFNDEDSMKPLKGNMKIRPSGPFKSPTSNFSAYSPSGYENQSSSSPQNLPPTRTAPPPPSQIKSREQQEDKEPHSNQSQFITDNSSLMHTPPHKSTFFDKGGGDLKTPSQPLTPYERELTSKITAPSNYPSLNKDQGFNDDHTSNRPVVPPSDRAPTYYCVKAVAGGKKTCKVSWTPPLPTNNTGGDGSDGSLGARMFCITSKAPNLLKASKTEILVAPPSSAQQSSKMNPISLKFVVTPPPTTSHSSSTSSAGSILEAIAEIYEVRNGGQQAAVDLLEFAVHVTRSKESSS